MATSCKFTLSGSAFTAFAVVAVSILAFINFHAVVSNVPTSSAAQQSEYADGADAMVAMQSDINIKSGPSDKCHSNSKSATCHGTTGLSDETVALQSVVNLELGTEGEENEGDEDDADSDTVVASQGTTSRVHLERGHEDLNDKGAADGQERESHPTNAVEGHAESLSYAPQEEKKGAVDSHANGPSSLLDKMAVNLQTLAIGENPSLAIGLMVLLLMCTCVGGMTLAYPRVMQFAGGDDSVSQKSSPGIEQREAMMERWPADVSDQPAPASTSILAPWPGQARHGHADHRSGHHAEFQIHSGQGSGRNSTPSVSGPLRMSKAASQASVGAVSMSRPASQRFMSTPGSHLSMSAPQDALSKIKMTGPMPGASLTAPVNTAPGASGREHLRNEREEAEEEVPPGVLPPPLCPMLVMPTCEARFGVPMCELAQVNGEGEVTIVGLSGAPLLRGVVRKVGQLRTLEIAMNDSSSAPRATIVPSPWEESAPGRKGAKTLDIRGVRGAPYGTLLMMSRKDGGTCSVVKDGETVLHVDGNAQNLRLTIKSGNGARLASVCCSSEAFGGIDHIEILVQKGVDTVLILAVVLSVLLLSPYLSDSESSQ